MIDQELKKTNQAKTRTLKTLNNYKDLLRTCAV